MKAFTPEILAERLRQLSGGDPPRRWLVAFSGGLDSTVLLHALLQIKPIKSVRAIHVDHQAQPDSGQFASHCRALCEEFGVDCEIVQVDIGAYAGNGPEAAMREARYAALSRRVINGDCLLSAHHEDDQAETLLLHLLRGSGPLGLAGIDAARQFGHGRLLRPLLGIDREALEVYATERQLRWIDDPSNADTQYDRNFLRREILPLLASRWPAVGNRLRRSAALASEASGLLDQLADIDLALLSGPAGAGMLKTPELAALSSERQRNVLRRALRLLKLPPAPASRLYEVVGQLVPARDDAEPLVCWPGVELRRYRDYLYLLPAIPEHVAAAGQRLLLESHIDLGPAMGRISLLEHDGAGLDPDVVGEGLTLAFRQGGEAIRIQPGGPTRKLKKLLQEVGAPPWMRERIPLLYAGDELVAVADLWISVAHSKTPGIGIRWQDRPPHVPEKPPEYAA